MKKISILLIALMVISVGLLSGCTETGDSPSNENDYYVPDIPKSYTVEYEVESYWDVDIHYTNPFGGTSQSYKSGSQDVWEKTYLSFQSGDWLYISAQIDNDLGSVTAKIYVNGNLFDSSYSSGAYAIASASGFLP